LSERGRLGLGIAQLEDVCSRGCGEAYNGETEKTKQRGGVANDEAAQKPHRGLLKDRGASREDDLTQRGGGGWVGKKLYHPKLGLKK